MQCAKRGETSFQIPSFEEHLFQQSRHLRWLSGLAFAQNPLSHSPLPFVGAFKQLNQLLVAQFRQIHRDLRPGGNFLSRLFTGVHHSPDASALAIDSFRIGLCILVAGILIAPIGNPKRAVRPDLFAHGAKPAVAGGKEIFFGDGFEAGAVPNEAIVIDGVLVNVAHENLAAIFRRKLIALINAHSTVGRTIMLMIDDGRQQLVAVRIGRRPSLSHVKTARRHVEQMIDDTGADEGVARAIKIHAPGVARAIRKHFELHAARLKACDGRRDFDARLRRLRHFHF